MSRQYPIWNSVSACHYNSDKSYGNKTTAEVSILVGSSSKNSNHFLKHVTTKRELSEFKGYKDVIVFRFSVDGTILKDMVFENNKGKAGALLKTFTKLNRIKSL